MNIWEIVKISNRNLLRNKLRSFLTIMAIFVGSFTLTMTNGLGDGLRNYVETQVKNIEANNILFVRKKFEMGEDNKKADEPNEYKESTTDQSGNVVDPNSMAISRPQMESILRDFPDVIAFTPRYSINGEYITLDGIKKYELNLGMLSEGVTQKTEAGKTIDGENQIMLPLALAKVLDENIGNLIGRNITIAYKVGQTGEIKTLSPRIVGISTKGFIANFNSFLDTKTAQKIYEDQNRSEADFNQFFSFTLQLKRLSTAKLEELKKNLDEKGFQAETIVDQQKRTYDAIGILQIGLNLFAMIALLAASFGIINTLVVAVLERTKEIGLQKALGMSRGRIFMLFSIESLLIGFWGAVIGIVVGIFIGIVSNIVLG